MKRDIGFKDFQAFNQALLAKQVWRILTCPNTLMTKLRKAKYFSKSLLQYELLMEEC